METPVLSAQNQVRDQGKLGSIEAMSPETGDQTSALEGVERQADAAEMIGEIRARRPEDPCHQIAAADTIKRSRFISRQIIGVDLVSLEWHREVRNSPRVGVTDKR